MLNFYLFFKTCVCCTLEIMPRVVGFLKQPSYTNSHPDQKLLFVNDNYNCPI